ncbi:MAG: FG-GAP repeat protein [Planctomycetes bacterium]|nr:FG-GAP repeat protein [Planctomycetota bacterium]
MQRSLLLVLPLLAPLALAQEEAQLVSADAAGGDQLGHWAGISGDTVVLGAPGDDDLGFFSGGAYVFAKSGGAWAQQAKLLPSDGGISQRFGWSADVDGDTAVVGAIFGNGLASVSGCAYVFTRSGTAWTQQAKLQASDGASSDWFSRSLAISGDSIAIGSAQDDDNGLESGSAYVYDRVGGAWVEAAKLKPSDGAAGDTFGEGLSIAGDLLVVGSPQDDDAGSASGSAYVFRRTGGVWAQEAKLTASDASFGDWFGKQVHTDGVRVIVGAYHGSGGGTLDTGAAYVFAQSGGVWVLEAKLVASDKSAGDEFGWTVNVTGDEALVGAVQRAGATGAVYRFAWNGVSWSEQEIVTASDASSADQYGWSLARDGAVAVVGATVAATGGAGYVLRWGPPATAYCFGDGSGTACPCGNVGAADAGCANSAGLGATAGSAGSASLATDDFVVTGAGLTPNQPTLLFAGLNAVNGGAGTLFGDGLRCAGGSVQRLGVHAASAGGAASWGPGLLGGTGWSAGDVRRFQLWYRDPVGPCGGGFNLSNGLELTVAP